jgi:hypothetical protein
MSPDKQVNVFHKLDTHTNFFEVAKKEIQGNNNPATMNSTFFNHCNKQKLLPLPVFKCIENNCFKFANKKLGLGYVQGLGHLIVENTDPSLHVLQLELNDCNMKDEEFATILESICSSKVYMPSLQTVKYSNNEMS